MDLWKFIFKHFNPHPLKFGKMILPVFRVNFKLLYFTEMPFPRERAPTPGCQQVPRMPWMTINRSVFSTISRSISPLLQNSQVPTKPLTPGEISRQELANTVRCLSAGLYSKWKYLTNYGYRDQLMKNRVGRALRSLKSFQGFQAAFKDFVQDEARRESEGILSDKDPARTSFSLDSLKQFSYKDQLARLQQSSPLLVAAVVGTISSKKVTDFDQITRKGFGGPKSDKEIDLGKG